MKKITAIILLVAAFSLAGGMFSTAQTKLSIKVTGADSMWGRIRSLALLYVKDHPQVNITVTPNALVDEGMAALIAGEADVAMASRRIIERESEAAKAAKLQLDEHVIGFGGIVIITHKQNPVDELSIDQVKKLFTGEIANWKEINGNDQPVKVFKSGEKHPGTLIFVENEILGGVPITENAVTLPDFPMIVKEVAETPGSVACVRMRDPFPGPEARTRSLKIKKDEHSPSIAPSRATISDGTYPLRRPYYLYTRADAGKEVLSFVDFAVGKGWGPPNLTHEW